MKKTYTYDPELIGSYGMDRMRFDLGDTMIEGKEETCALCDQEYEALIPDRVRSARHWSFIFSQCLELRTRSGMIAPYSWSQSAHVSSRPSTIVSPKSKRILSFP